MRQRTLPPGVSLAAGQEPDTPKRQKWRMTWAALTKMVYEVDPLKCPSCGGAMKVIAFIESSRQPEVVEGILRHCGLWRELPGPAWPAPRECTLDYGFASARLSTASVGVGRPTRRGPPHRLAQR